MERLFAYRGMACRVVGMLDCGRDSHDPVTYLFTLQPIGGGSEIPGVRCYQFEAADNVVPFPPQRAVLPATSPACCTTPASDLDIPPYSESGAGFSNYGEK